MPLDRPFVIEILGVAGSGKSTLAAGLAASLSRVGYAAADSRSTRFAAFGSLDRLAAGIRALPEFAGATAFVIGRIGRGDLPPSALSRLGQAYKHSRELRMLSRRFAGGGIIVQEPGRLMDLLTQYVHSRHPLPPAGVRRLASASPGTDVAIALRAAPAAALQRMRSRKRGLPQSFRGYDEGELDTVLRRGDAHAATIAAVCGDIGLPTFEIEVDDLDAAAVNERCLAFVLQQLASGRTRAR